MWETEGKYIYCIMTYTNYKQTNKPKKTGGGKYVQTTYVDHMLVAVKTKSNVIHCTTNRSKQFI